MTGKKDFTMHVSVGELARLAPDALRGLGFSYSLADCATGVLVWGEVVHGTALSFLADNGRKIEAATQAGYRLTHRPGPLPFHEVDAAGKSLLEAGPRALDLAQAEVSEKPGMVVLRNTSGTFLAGALADRAVARGLSLMVVSAAGNGRDAFERSGVTIGIAPGQQQGSYTGGLEHLIGQDGPRRLEELGFARKIVEDTARFVSQFVDTAQGGIPSLAILAWRFGEAGEADAAAQAASRWCQVADSDTIMKDALTNGIEVDANAWSAFGSYIQRTRIPTSERSRTQAG